MSTGGTNRTSIPVPPALPPMPPALPEAVWPSAQVPAALPTADLSCPRCGYDQSGLADNLCSQCERGELDAWPLRSTCAECGYSFDWSDLYNAAAREDVVFFETWRFGPWSALRRTVNRMSRAGRFWRWVRMEWPVHEGRMTLATMAACALWCATLCIGLIVLVLVTDLAMQATRNIQVSGYGAFLVPALWDFSGALAAPWLAVPWDNRRTSWYGLPNTTTWAIISCGAVLLTPLVFRLLPQTLRKANVRGVHLVRVWCYALPRLLLSVMVAAALPRAIAVAIDLLILINDMVGVALIDWRLSSLFARIVERGWSDITLIAIVLFFAWRWWSCACRDYLKLPHAHAIAAAMLTITFLACWILALITPATSGAATMIN